MVVKPAANLVRPEGAGAAGSEGPRAGVPADHLRPRLHRASELRPAARTGTRPQALARAPGVRRRPGGVGASRARRAALADPRVRVRGTRARVRAGRPASLVLEQAVEAGRRDRVGLLPGELRMAGHEAEDDRAEQDVRRGRGADLGSDLAAIERALPKLGDRCSAGRPGRTPGSTAKRRGRSRTRPATGRTPGRVHCCRTHSPDGPARSGRRPRNPCQARESPPHLLAERLGRGGGPDGPCL